MLNKYLEIPFVEMEIRLGTYGKTFDSNIDQNYFQKILGVLETGKCWVGGVETKKTIEYLNSESKTRLTEPIGNVILKENVFTKTIRMDNCPFDLRFSVNQELSLQSYKSSFNKKNCMIRNKNRKSFIADNFRYDLTIVEQIDNNIKINKHEIEIELLVNENTLTWSSEYIHDYLKCRVSDLINIVEKTEIGDNFQLN